MNDNFSEENGNKAKHGANAKESLRKAIEELEEYGAIIKSQPSPTYGYEGYEKDQFDAHEEITYSDDTKAILYATTSLRSDRVETDQWRAHNIKCIDPRIEYAYVVLPDQNGYDKGTSTRDKIREGKVFSAIDDIMTLQEFYDNAIKNYLQTLEKGSHHDLQGRKLEDLFSSILSDKNNIGRYNGSTTDTGFMYDVFSLVLNKLAIPSGKVKSITTTTDIPKLPSGGNPKTDVAATVEFVNGDSSVFTFSLKNTARSSVSVHEYSADVFADVLDSSNAELRRLLNVFQSIGNKRDMRQEDIQALTNTLSPYREALNRWVFSGIGPKNIKPIQIADYIVVRDKNTSIFSIHTIDEYCTKQEAEADKSKWFGTIFSWTYPSKKRGKRIQLKARVLH